VDAVYKGQFEAAPAVIVRGLTKRFGGWRNKFTAVDNVWYSMPPNSLFALLGHNGSGKSTTFNALTGLTNVTSGDAEIFGKSVQGCVGRVAM
jgi:ribosome-dependent ATPase